MKTFLFLGLGLAFCMASVAAQESSGPAKPSSSARHERSSAEIAKESHNPLGNLSEMILQLDILPNVGQDKKTALVGTIQTVFPFTISDSWKVMTYGIVPVVSQPGMSAGDDRIVGLGDSAFFGYFTPANEGKLIWGIGPAVQVPTQRTGHSVVISGRPVLR